MTGGCSALPAPLPARKPTRALIIDVTMLVMMAKKGPMSRPLIPATMIPTVSKMRIVATVMAKMATMKSAVDLDADSGGRGIQVTRCFFGDGSGTGSTGSGQLFQRLPRHGGGPNEQLADGGECSSDHTDDDAANRVADHACNQQHGDDSMDTARPPTRSARGRW